MSPLTPAHLIASDRRLQALELKRLHLKIGVVAAIVMAELWALTAALQGWGEGRMESLPWLLAFQLAGFAGALATWMVTPGRSAAPHSVAPIGSPQSAAAE